MELKVIKVRMPLKTYLTDNHLTKGDILFIREKSSFETNLGQLFRAPLDPNGNTVKVVYLESVESALIVKACNANATGNRYKTIESTDDVDIEVECVLKKDIPFKFVEQLNIAFNESI